MKNSYSRLNCLSNDELTHACVISAGTLMALIRSQLPDLIIRVIMGFTVLASA